MDAKTKVALCKKMIEEAAVLGLETAEELRATMFAVEVVLDFQMEGCHAENDA